jgi:diapolycopene oxygenase
VSTSKKKVLVVGAGLGGMAAAIALAQKGFAVELFEKNSHLGGKLNVLKEGGFSFDLGPSIFTLPHMFRPLFEEGTGRKLEDYVKLQRLDPQWRNFFEDGSVIDLFEDRKKMDDELRQKVSEAAVDDYARFLKYSKLQYDITDRGYFAEGLDGFWDFARFYGLRGAAKLDFLGTMAGGIARYFSDEKLRAIFEYFIKYVGSSAYDSPGFMNLMPNIQLEFGLWYIEGGLFELSKAFEKRLSECGVRVHLGTEVLSIEKQGKQVTGLRARGDGQAEKFVAADFVVSNMEVIPAYKSLLGEKPRFMRKLERFEPACSGIVLHLGTKKRYPQLAHHNFFYSQNQEKHFHRVFREKKLPDDPTIYLVAPSRTDATQAPEGCENIKILPHIPYINDKVPYTYEDCVALKERVIDKLERMGLTDLRKSTIVEDFWTPFDIEKKYYSNKGSIYGVVSDRKRNFAFKAPKRSSQYRNLFFVGGSVNPGGGMPMVVLSGRHVARWIAETSAAK